MITYTVWLIMIVATVTIGWFASSTIEEFQRKIEWESYAAEHNCRMSEVDRKIWVCMSPTPTWIKKED